ncbi:hypothetical protein ACFLY7_02155 [Patescibacteria group bacterium]
MSQKPILTSEKVTEIFMDCLFKKEELPPKEFIPASGITSDVDFHPKRIAGYKEKIAEMLNKLPDAFHEGKGDGMSFLNACKDKHGHQWTGLHHIMEQLFQLGLAVGKVKCLMPKEMWQILPGGMPYYMITKEFSVIEPQTKPA